MADHKGDKSKQPPSCDTSMYTRNRCPNLKEVGLTSMDGERYECGVCGEYFFLDYEDMK